MRRRDVASTAETLAVTRELTIDARPDTVWEFLVDPLKAALWMGRRSSSTPARAASTRSTC